MAGPVNPNVASLTPYKPGKPVDELTRELGLSHLYLGYWVRDAEKMRYKTDYRPAELFVNGRWVRIT